MQSRKRKLSTQPSVLTSFAKPTPYEPNCSKVRKVNSLLVKSVCKDALPFRLVESESFNAFVRELDPRYRLPTRKALSHEMIPNTYDVLKQSVMSSLSQATAVALTTDAWTSVTNDAFLGVTAHFVLDDFTYVSRCLTVKHAPGNHTAEAINKQLEEICREWDIKQRSQQLPLYIVTDNGANVKKAINTMQHTQWVACFAHTLQLVIHKVLALDELSEVSDLLVSARAIVGHFRRSPVATKKLEQAQQQLGVPQHRLIQCCSTRWNSEVLMLQRLIEQKNAISLVLSSVSGVKNLDGDQWRAAVLLVEALRPFLDATTIVSATRYPTLSMVIPLLDGITDVLHDEETAESIPCLRTALMQELNDRFSYVRNSSIHYVATVVDPRYKLIPVTDEFHAVQAQTAVVSAMARGSARLMSALTSNNELNINQSQNSQHQNLSVASTAGAGEQSNMVLHLSCQQSEGNRAKLSLWDKFDRLVSSQHQTRRQSTTECYQQELQLYLNEPVIERSSCPFRWWSLNKARFPSLATVAREFLAIPCTSVPTERLFSKAGEIITKKRSSIKPMKADQTIFLMENM